jgi:methionyl-tRNA formyltransferase
MKTKIIFFGNGPLADYSKSILAKHFDIIFHARTKDDLETVKSLKREERDAFGVLASFGVMIKSDVLELFEPTGILNLHPSLLPQYRGSSPIESAILNGDKAFSFSIMKLVKAMDAGPVYHQETINFIDPYPTKDHIYQVLAEAGANWIVKNINHLPTPTIQDEKLATFTEKFDKSRSRLQPTKKPAEALLDEIRAFIGFPKSKYTFFGLDCIILSAHISTFAEHQLNLKCADGKYLIIDKIQPAGRKIMDAKSFLNGYAK